MKEMTKLNVVQNESNEQKQNESNEQNQNEQNEEVKGIYSFY